MCSYLYYRFYCSNRGYDNFTDFTSFLKSTFYIWSIKSHIGYNKSVFLWAFHLFNITFMAYTLQVVMITSLSNVSFSSKYNNAWCIPWRTILFEVVLSTIPLLTNFVYFIVKVHVPVPGLGEQVVFTCIINSFNFVFNGWMVLHPSLWNYLTKAFIVFCYLKIS